MALIIIPKKRFVNPKAVFLKLCIEAEVDVEVKVKEKSV